MADGAGEHVHNWVLDELYLSIEGADRIYQCWCGTTTLDPGGQGIRPALPDLPE